jgi:hypothetical protein
LLKNSKEQIARRLKPARDDKNKGLGRGAEAPHYPNDGSKRVFQQTVQPVRLKRWAILSPSRQRDLDLVAEI